ncbi:MAG TPA: response regulator transcription factor [Puia sp.]|jgi:DNA-binding NarL/FixJ family response regulator|nr:response regulator transcription factor [Puia sp.]
MKITIGIADDHQLFLKSLALLINSFPGFEVILEALNGERLLQELAVTPVLPDILLLDVNMPVMDGPQTTTKILAAYPGTRIAALSMKADDTTIIRMLKAGSCAYLLKDIHPDELERALTEIAAKGYYNADAFNVNYRRLIIKAEETKKQQLNGREQHFLQLSCSDLTYKEIAGQMFLSDRTIDGYRESVFEKLNVKSRVGMVLEGIRQGLISL